MDAELLLKAMVESYKLWESSVREEALMSVKAELFNQYAMCRDVYISATARGLSIKDLN